MCEDISKVIMNQSCGKKCEFYLRQHRDVFHVVVIAQGTHEAIAQAGLANADLALVLFCAGQSDHSDVDVLRVVALPRHFQYTMISPNRQIVRINILPLSFSLFLVRSFVGRKTMSLKTLCNFPMINLRLAQMRPYSFGHYLKSRFA